MKSCCQTEDCECKQEAQQPNTTAVLVQQAPTPGCQGQGFLPPLPGFYCNSKVSRSATGSLLRLLDSLAQAIAERHPEAALQR